MTAPTTARTMRLCCGIYTYAVECGDPCWPVDPLPWSEHTIRVPAKPCGHLHGDECGCDSYYFIAVQREPLRIGDAWWDADRGEWWWAE